MTRVRIFRAVRGGAVVGLLEAVRIGNAITGSGTTATEPDERSSERTICARKRCKRSRHRGGARQSRREPQKRRCGHANLCDEHRRRGKGWPGRTESLSARRIFLARTSMVEVSKMIAPEML